MPTKERLASLGMMRSRALAHSIAGELRTARLSAGLSQAAVGVAAGLSQRTIGRIESGEPPFPTLSQIARTAVVVGLELRIQVFPAGGPLRDAAHVALIGRFLARVAALVKRRLEAPVRLGDLRAWDVLLEVDGVRIGIVAETRIRDLQALLRREHRKQLDGGVDLLLLVVSDTAHNRRALAEASPLLSEEFPLGTRAVLTALGRSAAPRANGVVVL